MSRRRLAGAIAAAALFAWPASAEATHSGCEWGASVDVDPQRPDPVRLRVGPFFWFCPGPVLSVRFGADPARTPETGPPAAAQRPPLRLEISPRTIRAGRTARLRLRAFWIGPPDEPAAGETIRIAGRDVHLGPSGEARLRIRPRRAGRLTATAADEATASVRVLRARRRG